MGENWGVRIATVHLNGQFGFNEGSAVWEMCQPEQQRCQVYYFDMSDVTDLRPDGLTWLRLFLCWARESGCSVRFINTPADLRRCLATAGINVEGTAAERTTLPPSDPRAPGSGPARRQDLAEALHSVEAQRTLRFG